MIDELDRAYDFISTNFSVENAKKKLSRFRDKMNQLGFMPGGFDFDERIKRQLHPVFKTQALVCEDYLMLFVVDEANKLVIVTHLIPSKSDYMRLLKN